ncbi:unnamed protein product [Eruca vesicaria subsp. sativa]|uniref:Uncharacterized protein n=1 Tax=Eruca vesicaria subsp. sativa TaxID=29727 RepID=A0ABC8IYJ4_ERUVS|nr:unnamed protein product [Eruca vesicaria subsp. sativa]
MGFFAEADPVQIFGSKHVKIQKECEVRLQIIGTRVDATEIVRTILHDSKSTMQQLIFCVGTIVYDFLGVINDPAAAA